MKTLTMTKINEMLQKETLEKEDLKSLMSAIKVATKDQKKNKEHYEELILTLSMSKHANVIRKEGGKQMEKESKVKNNTIALFMFALGALIAAYFAEEIVELKDKIDN